MQKDGVQGEVVCVRLVHVACVCVVCRMYGVCMSVCWMSCGGYDVGVCGMVGVLV